MTTTRTNDRAALFTAASCIALVVAAATPASAHQHHDDGIGGGAFFGYPATWQVLDLTGEQKRAMRVIVHAHWAELDRLAADERGATAAIRDKLFGTDPVTPEALDELARHELETRSALTRERLATALEVRNALTPEQIGRIASLRTTLGQMARGRGVGNRGAGSRDGQRRMRRGFFDAPL